MLESLNYSFRNPKKHNLSNLPHQTVEKLQKNNGVLRRPQLGKERWRARLGILRLKNTRKRCAYTKRWSKTTGCQRVDLEKQKCIHVSKRLYQVRYFAWRFESRVFQRKSMKP